MALSVRSPRPAVDGKHGVYRILENGGVAFPFCLVKLAVLVEVHTEKAVADGRIAHLGAGEFAVAVLVPFLQGDRPRFEGDFCAGVAARSPRGHENGVACGTGAGMTMRASPSTHQSFSPLAGS